MKKNERKLISALIIMAYVIVIIIFGMTVFQMTTGYSRAEEKYIDKTRQELDTLFQTNINETQIIEALPAFVQKHPMELVLEQNNKTLYATTSMTPNELRDYKATDVFLLKNKLKYTVNNRDYLVSFNLYHLQMPAYITRLSQQQTIILGVAFLILLTAILIMQYLLIRPLELAKKNITRLENFELEGAITQKQDDVVNAGLRDFALNLQKNIQHISRDYTELEQALQLEKERLANMIIVSRAYVHDLKSPVHQTMLENELTAAKLADKTSQSNEILAYNVNQAELIVKQINDILLMMDKNIYEEDEKEQVDIVRLFTDAKNLFKANLKKHKLFITLDTPEVVTINANAVTVKLLIHNMMSNATQYAKEASEIHCEIHETKKHVQIICENESTIENTLRMKDDEHLFKTNVLDEHKYSTGKGLLLIKELTYVLGGQYEFSSFDEGVKISITLPKQ